MGAFFGTAGLMLALSLVAFRHSRRRVALMAALSALVSACFAIAYLGWLPLEGAAEARMQAHIAMLAASTLALMLLSTLGLLRADASARRACTLLGGSATLVIAIGWMLDAAPALALSSVVAFAIGAAMLVIVTRSARRGDRRAWVTVLGVACMLISLTCLSWIALNGSVSWMVHATSALSATAYLATMASAVWTRYSYLLELADVMKHGPAYDLVTRMRSHGETGQMAGNAFFKGEGAAGSGGVIAVCIANLYALEHLHGRAAINHALFIFAGRLRRCVPQSVELGRLGDDGFLLLARNVHDLEALGQVARSIRTRLSKPVALSTSRAGAGLERATTAWMAEVGVGVLGASTQIRPSQAVATARTMARSAWTYGSRLAFFDQVLGQIAEMPLEPSAAVPLGARAVS